MHPLWVHEKLSLLHAISPVKARFERYTQTIDMTHARERPSLVGGYVRKTSFTSPQRWTLCSEEVLAFVREMKGTAVKPIADPLLRKCSDL